MRGTNELILNQQTITEAVQEYLDKRMGIFAPSVSSIGSFGAMFKVVTREKSLIEEIPVEDSKTRCLPEYGVSAVDILHVPV